MQVDHQGSKCVSLRSILVVMWGFVVLDSLLLVEKEAEPAGRSIDSSHTLHCELHGGIAGLVMNLKGKLLLNSVAMTRERLGSGQKAAREGGGGVAGLRLAWPLRCRKMGPLWKQSWCCSSLGSSSSLYPFAQWRISESVSTSLGHG